MNELVTVDAVLVTDAITAWLRYLLIAAGILYLITESVIFSPVRKTIYKLLPQRFKFGIVVLYCPACLGFWCGLTLGALHLWPADTGSAWAILECGLATMAFGAVSAHYSNAGRIYDIEIGQTDALAQTQTTDDEDADGGS